METKICEQCHKEFIPRLYWQRFCSKACVGMSHRGKNKSLKSTGVEEHLKAITDLTHGKIYNGMLTDIGEEFGLSRERIRQIANRAGYMPAHETAKQQLLLPIKCTGCGIEFIPKTPNYRFHSPSCRRNYSYRKNYVQASCFVCGKKKYILRSQFVKEKHYFCSKTCQGIWLGKTYGVYPRGNVSYIRRMSSDELKSVLGTEPFPTIKFSKIFGYASPEGGTNMLNKLIYDLKIRHLERGIYQII